MSRVARKSVSAPPHDAPAHNWPADRVERRAVAELVPYARNARIHSPAQVGQIAASINEWGWTMPVLVDETGQLIAGHGRVLAAQKLGLAEVPTMTAVGWTDAQKRAYVLADNKLALNAGWDAELLTLEISDLQQLDAGLGLTGFNDDEIARLLGNGNEMPELSGDSKLGEGVRYQIVMDCRGEQDQADMLKRLREDGRECRPLML